MKGEFEKYILLENFEQAQIILNSIEDKVCYSNWTLENKLLLEEKSNGTEANWKILNEMSYEIKDSLLQFLADQSSKKAEEKFSYSGYRSNFESIINGADPYVSEYLCYKLLYPGYTGFQNYGFYINVESISSVVDRYVNLLDVLTDLVQHDPTFVSKIVSELRLIFKEDLRLEQLYRITTAGSDFRREQNNFVCEILNLYTEGSYSEVIKKCKQFISNEPSSLEPYILYSKSLIENGDGFLGSGISATVDSILLILYNIYSLNKEFNNSVEDGFKTSLQLFSHDLGKQLSSVIGNYVMLREKEDRDSIHHYVFSRLYNPSISYYTGYDYFEFNPPESFVEKIHQAILTGSYDLINIPNIIPEHKQFLYKVKSLFMMNKFGYLVEEHRSNNSILDQMQPYSLKEYYEYVYESCVKTNSVTEAVNIYLEAYFKNNNYIVRMNRDFFRENDKLQGLSSIEAAILSYVIGNSSYNIYVQYDNYMQSKGYLLPTEIKWETSTDPEMRAFFLGKVCTTDVLQYSIEFQGPEHIQTERINVLKDLLIFDEANSESYIQQISEITRRSRVRSLIRDVNKGRISVNTQQIKEQESNLVRDKYIRFKALQEFSKNTNTKVLDSTSKLITEYFSKMYDINTNEDMGLEKNDPAFAFYKLIFLELRDKFLFSKDFGLDGYLSTRIRHGTLANHIRSVFESQDLLFQKRSDAYVSDKNWDEFMESTVGVNISKLREIFIDFSSKVDDFTQTLVKEYIQIITERKFDKQKSLFNFAISDDQFRVLYNESNITATNHVGLMNYIFDILETMLIANLKSIRYVLNNQVKEYYLDLLNEFYEKINDIDSGNSLTLLYQSISRSQTEIINELQRISAWFNLSNPSIDSTLDIETIVETAVEITNTIYPNKNLSATINDISGVPFTIGTTNMIYICRIILDNVIKHSGLDASSQVVEVKSELIKNNTVLALSFKNNIDPKLSGSVNSALKKVKDEWEVNRLNYKKINEEGGSGYDKIRKMMAIDMQMDKYDWAQL
jgi:hypothetical protein